MGKLRRIKERFKTLEANVNLATKKIEEVESLKETLVDLQTKFNEIYNIFMTPDEEVSEEDIKKQQEEAMSQMKGVVREAISDMLADPENQKSIQAFASQFSNSMTGQAGGLPFDLNSISDEDGHIDPIKAVFMWFANRKKGDAFSGIVPTSGKTTGY